MQKYTRFFALLVSFILLVSPAAQLRASAQTPGPADGGNGESQPVPGKLIVRYKKMPGLRVFALPGVTTMQESGEELSKINAVEITVPVGQEEQVRLELLKNPDVLYVDRDYYAELQNLPEQLAPPDIIPNDPLWKGQYGPTNINMPEAWAILSQLKQSGVKPKSVTIAIIDSGIDRSHPDFSGRILPGYDFWDNDSIPNDLIGHGTHVAGIAAATGNNGLYIAGVNWDAKIMSLRVTDYGKGIPYVLIARAIIYAVDHGANVINMSLGGGDSSNLLYDSVKYAYARNVAIFAAAGNSNMEGLLYPAAYYPEVLAVGAVDINNRYSYFEYASFDHQRLVVAPGVNILSTFVGHSSAYLSGTSMATPHVAGAAALLASLPDFQTPDQIYQALVDTAKDVGAPGWDKYMGYGLIQVDLAMKFAGPFIPPEEFYGPGYIYVTSRDCDLPLYEWKEIAALENQVFTSITDRRKVVGFGGKSFSYAGENKNEIEIAANGYLRFVDPAKPYSGFTDTSPQELPYGFEPYNIIAPLWNNYTYSTKDFRQHVYAFQDATQLIVQWDKVYINSNEFTFQAILNFADGSILFQYKDLNGPLTNGVVGSVGLDYAKGLAGIQYSHDQTGTLRPGLAIKFIPLGTSLASSYSRCLFVTFAPESMKGCDQTEFFGVNVFEGLLPTNVSTFLSIRNLAGSPGDVPQSYIPMNRYADITFDPMPVTPFDPRPRVCYHYTPQDVLRAGGHAENMFLATYSPSGGWQKLSTVVNTQNATLSAPASHFSGFGVFAAQKPKRLPVTGSDYPQPSLPWVVVAVALGVMTGLFRMKRR